MTWADAVMAAPDAVEDFFRECDQQIAEAHSLMRGAVDNDLPGQARTNSARIAVWTFLRLRLTALQRGDKDHDGYRRIRGAA